MFVLKAFVVAAAVSLASIGAAAASPEELPTHAYGTTTVSCVGETECAAVQGAKRRAEAAAGGSRFTVIRMNTRQIGDRWVSTWTIRIG